MADANEDDLSLISDWSRRRVEGGPTTEPIDDLQQRFVERKIARLRDAVAAPVQLVTARLSVNPRSNFLTPIYSLPPALRGFVEKPENQVPFSFEVIDEAPFSGLVDVKIDTTGEREIFTAMHKVGNGRGTPETEFGARIDAFWARLAARGDAHLKSLATKKPGKGHATYCLFSGRRRLRADKAKEPHVPERVELDAIVALYFIGTAKLPRGRVRAMLDTTLSTTAALFSGIDLINTIDSNLFRAEGLELVARLQPEFARPKVAPADKIAFAIERLRGLLRRHLIARHGEIGEPRLYYLTAAFAPSELEQGRRVFVPHLRVYPHEFCKQLAVESLVASHEDIVSPAKLLLRHYVEHQSHIIVESDQWTNDPASVELASGFRQLVSAKNLSTVPMGKLTKRFCRVPDEIYMTDDDDELFPDLRERGKESPWRALKVDIACSAGVRSILGFVIEGERVAKASRSARSKTVRRLPLGIFMIESPHAGAFSHKDITSLREVMAGIASLLRQISHENSSLDYRASVGRIFYRYAPPRLKDQEKLTDAIFCIQKLDGDVFRTIINSSRRAGPATFGLEDAAWTFLKRLSNEIDPIADEDIRDKRGVNDALRERRRKFVELARANETLATNQEVIKFLAACPENFAWANFLSSISQVLGDRASSRLPQFLLMAPGFSASDLLMARIEQELRQVVKLGSARDLQLELSNYKLYVRYKLVLAARIPGNGLAFDTRGLLGQNAGARGRSTITLDDKYEDTAYGALVSDLVSGDEKNESAETTEHIVHTLLSVTARCYRDAPKGDVQDICKALKTLFEENQTLWREAEFPSKPEGGALVMIRRAFRVAEHHTDRRYQILDDNMQLLAHRALRSEVDVKEAWAAVKVLEHSIDPDSVASLQSVIHGDLNARNLTWAGAIRQFFLIDFGHVGEGFRGADQFRLVVNLVLELWREARTSLEENPQWSDNIYGDIEFAVDFFAELQRSLTGPGDYDSIGEISDRVYVEITRKRRKTPGPLIQIVKQILETIDPHRGGIGRLRKSFWAYCLFAAVLKEFEYSCRPFKVRAIDAGRVLDEISESQRSGELRELPIAQVVGRLDGLNIDAAQPADYVRLILASRILVEVAKGV